MPRAAAMLSTLLIPIRSTVRAPTGELQTTWSYASAVATPCRLFVESAAGNRRVWGEQLEVDAMIWIPASVAIEPLTLTADEGSARQVQVDGVKYMAIKAIDLGHMGKVKAVALRRYSHA